MRPLSLALCILIGGIASAQSVWTGATDNRLSTPTNWTVAPTLSDTLEFPSSKAGLVIYDRPTQYLLFDAGTLAGAWTMSPSPSPSPMAVGKIDVEFTDTVTASSLAGDLVLGLDSEFTFRGRMDIKGNIDTAGHSLFIDSSVDMTLNNLTGGGTVAKGSAGTLTLSGNADNVIGRFNLDAGKLVLAKSGGKVALNGLVGQAGTTTQYLVDDAIADAADCGTGGILDLNGHHDTVHDLTISQGGTLALGAGGAVTSTGTFTLGAGTIDGDAASRVTASAGVFDLSTSTSWGGTLDVGGGSVQIGGNLQLSLIARSGTRVTGTGSLASLTSVGAILQLSTGLTVKSLSLDGASSCQLVFANNGQGQILVQGPVALGGALSVDVGTTYANTPFVLLQNDGSDPIVGTFTGLPEGAVFEATLVGGKTNPQFTISYVGGDGNDVALTPVATKADGGVADLSTGESPDLSVPVTPNTKSSGCSCELGGGATGGGFALLVFAVAAVLVLRRRV